MALDILRLGIRDVVAIMQRAKGRGRERGQSREKKKKESAEVCLVCARARNKIVGYGKKASVLKGKCVRKASDWQGNAGMMMVPKATREEMKNNLSFNAV